MEAWRAAIIAEAKTWLRTPWKHEARIKGPGGGADCGQLVIACYVAAGLVEDFATGTYPRDWMLHRSEERYLGWIEQYLDRVERPEPGDVAVWRWGRTFSHGAIVVEWPQVIHAFRPERNVSWGDGSTGPLARGPGGEDREVRFYSIAGRLSAAARKAA